MNTRIDQLVGGIYRISTWQEPYGMTFNQFLIADERPALIHTGMRDLYGAIREVLDPAKLEYVVLLHWEGDENGGMDQFMKDAPKSQLIGRCYQFSSTPWALDSPSERAGFATEKNSTSANINCGFWKHRTCITRTQ